MKMEENSFKIVWFLLSIWLLFQQLFVNGFSLEEAIDENGVMESNNSQDIDLNGRMTRLEVKSLKQEREIEVLHTLLEEEKKFSKQLSGRILQLEASTATPTPVKSDELLGRSKRLYRLFSQNFPDAKENGNTDQLQQFFGPPANCHEVGQLGYTLNGYYLIKRRDDSNDNGKIGVAYCRFQELEKTNPATLGLQEAIGILDVKTKDDVHFYVQRNSSFGKDNSVIPFELARLNKGGAMNLSSGIFTAPVTGIYHFQFTGVKDSNSDYLKIFLQVNGGNVGLAYTEDTGRTKAAFGLSLTSSLRLKVNDRVNLYKLSSGILYDDSLHFTHFTGWLVDEELI